MTITKHTELLQIATKAAAYITKLHGESETFQIDGDTLSAQIKYEAEIGYDPGDRWVAPCWWIEHEETTILGVYNEEGEDVEAAEWLKKMLN